MGDTQSPWVSMLKFTKMVIHDLDDLGVLPFQETYILYLRGCLKACFTHPIFLAHQGH